MTEPHVYCPKCGVRVIMSETCAHGYDECANGHVYPSEYSLPERTAFYKYMLEHQITKEEIEKWLEDNKELEEILEAD